MSIDLILALASPDSLAARVLDASPAGVPFNPGYVGENVADPYARWKKLWPGGAAPASLDQPSDAQRRALVKKKEGAKTPGGRQKAGRALTDFDKTVRAAAARNRKAWKFVPNLRWYDVIIANSSGGKDSIAVVKLMLELAKKQGVEDRLLIVHDDLGDVEWTGARQLVEEHAAQLGLPLKVVTLGTTLLEEIRDTGRFPDAMARFCTGKFKTSPEGTMITEIIRGLSAQGPQPRPLRVLSALGIRAAESPSRAKKVPFDRPPKRTSATRTVHRWLPIHNWSDEQVYRQMRRGPLRAPPQYAVLDRYSCKLCIMGSQSSIVMGALMCPDNLSAYRTLERDLTDPKLHPARGDVVVVGRGRNRRRLIVLKRHRQGSGGQRRHSIEFYTVPRQSSDPVAALARAAGVRPKKDEKTSAWRGRALKEATSGRKDLKWPPPARHRLSKRGFGRVSLEQWRELARGANVEVVAQVPGRRFPVLPIEEVSAMVDRLRRRGVDPYANPQQAKRQVERQLDARRARRARR